ncbi:hypothetical protein LPJ66_000998 [Kickxella alabastrina]|uniref:Uncharacterized protein n=1 Tax=Kickxella alabastrina TaxID=61397 RepID=A0ACC1IUI9_9FUNG|nr:hypothetical protein LPJ66_000998 [Kickxella alabastrina]
MSATIRHFSVKNNTAGIKRKMRLQAQKNYVCFYCNALYDDLAAYDYHVESVHGP